MWFVVRYTGQEIGWEERLRNSRFCVEWDVKPQLNQSMWFVALWSRPAGRRLPPAPSAFNILDVRADVAFISEPRPRLVVCILCDSQAIGDIRLRPRSGATPWRVSLSIGRSVSSVVPLLIHLEHAPFRVVYSYPLCSKFKYDSSINRK